ncbi:hypothetical protein K438DRAFT_1785842 [Mycena galopus ATCC 62051]|nr:hypothetical protein K438DRAFT_1785842 [Mycena galopus ATCC 62051]
MLPPGIPRAPRDRISFPPTILQSSGNLCFFDCGEFTMRQGTRVARTTQQENVWPASTLTRLAIPSWDLATPFCAMDEESKGHALTPRLRSFGLMGLCFQIDNCLEHDPSDEMNGVLANLLFSWFPSLAVLEMDLEMFTRDELESRLVSTVQGQFTVTRPTYCLEQYRNHGPQDGYSGFPGTNFESDPPLCGRQLIYGR